MISMSSFTGKTILSFLRSGDYAHAGEEEAIRLALQPFAKDSNRVILDVGCGIGGTAKFIQDQGWGKVFGVDIDAEAVKYANKTYPDVNFQVCAAGDVAAKFLPKQFDLICFFNVFYAISDRKTVLESLHKVSKEDAKLMVFDYVNLVGDKRNFDENNDPQYFVNPASRPSVCLKDFSNLAEQAGWEITEIKNLDNEYIKWYSELLAKIEINRDKIIELFGKDALGLVEKTYNDIYNSLLAKKMGGAIIYATSKK